MDEKEMVEEPVVEEKEGIVNVILVLDPAIEFGNVIGDVMALPKELNTWDKVKIVGRMADEIWALFSVKWKKVIPEFKDISAAEKVVINAHFVAKFDIPQDKVEAIVEKAVNAAYKLADAGYDLYEIAVEIKALKKKV